MDDRREELKRVLIGMVEKSEEEMEHGIKRERGWMDKGGKGEEIRKE